MTAPSQGTHSSSAPSTVPPPIVHALSGALGAVMAMALLYPLDQVRAILQVDDELAKECSGPGGTGVLGALSCIIRKQGRGALWRGMVPVLITMGVSNFVYFYCFNGLKAALLSRRRHFLPAQPARTATGVLSKDGAPLPPTVLGAGGGDGKAAAAAAGKVPGLTPLETMLASTLAGVVNVLATTPLWVSNLRIKAGNGVGGLFSTVLSIGRTEGLSGLWSGTAPSLVLVSNPMIQFVVYETLKQAAANRRVRRHSSSSSSSNNNNNNVSAPLGTTSLSSNAKATGLPSHEAFLLGATAKAISTLITYPLQLAQTKLRVGGAAAQGLPAEDPPAPAEGWRSSLAWQALTWWSSTAEVLISVCREKGVSGMYQGMRAKLLHTVLTSALLFLGYERLVQVITNVIADRAGAAAAAASNDTASPLVRVESSMSKKVA